MSTITAARTVAGLRRSATDRKGRASEARERTTVKGRAVNTPPNTASELRGAGAVRRMFVLLELLPEVDESSSYNSDEQHSCSQRNERMRNDQPAERGDHEERAP
jgi:hypothetical protein